jgi:hypothetical protein
MRDSYSLNSFFRALDAWEKHLRAYLETLEKARQPAPTVEQMVGYRNVWIEGWLECNAENNG